MSHTIVQSCTGCTACVGKCPVDAIAGDRKGLHVIDPSLCIDCGACGRICPSEAVLDEEGRLCRQIKPAQWLRPVWRYEACVKCRICVSACPTGSIDLARGRAGLAGVQPAYPFLQQPKTCIGCYFCEQSCPTDAIVMKEPQRAAVAIAS